MHERLHVVCIACRCSSGHSYICRNIACYLTAKGTLRKLPACNQPMSASDACQHRQVRPTLARLQATLLAAGGALVLGSGLLLSLILGSADADGVYGALDCHRRKGPTALRDTQKA